MKKNIFQIIIISILLIGMSVAVFVINKNMQDFNQFDYYPSSNNTDLSDAEEMLDLSGYTRLSVENVSFTVFPYYISTKTYYDNDLSYEKISLDSVSVEVGDKIVSNTVLGVKDGVTVVAPQNCMVVDVDMDGITVKNLSTMFATFNYNIYKIYTYKVGDEFDVYKNGVKKSTATIISVDYLNVVDDCVKVVVKINDDDMIFISSTDIELVPKNCDKRESLALNSSDLGIYDLSYKEQNKFYELIFVKDSKAIPVNVLIGISYGGYSEIVSVTSGTYNINVSEGSLYAKVAN